MIYSDIVRSLNKNFFNKLYTRVCIDKLPDRKRKTTRSSIVVIFCNQHSEFISSPK